jgi:vitamin B12 transporter
MKNYLKALAFCLVVMFSLTGSVFATDKEKESILKPTENQLNQENKTEQDVLESENKDQTEEENKEKPALETIELEKEDTAQGPCPVIQFGHCKQEQVYSFSNMPEDEKTSSANVDVITREEIEMINPTNIEDILNTVGGITSYSNGSPGSLSPYRMRGWNKSLLNIDGVRINSLAFNAPYLQDIEPFGLDRIEVIRGPQGTIHGTQAQGGLIGLFTRTGHGRPQIEIESGMGNNSTFRENFAFSGGNRLYDYFLGITRHDTTGGSPTTPDNRSVNDDYRNLTVASNLGVRLLNGKAEIRNTFRYINAKKEIGTTLTGFPMFDPYHNSFNSYGYEVFTFTHAPVNFYDYYLKMGVIKDRYKDINPFDPINAADFMWSPYYRTDNNRIVFMTQHNLRMKNINTLTVGYELEYNDFSTVDAFAGRFDKDLSKNDVYLNDVINIKDILFIRGGCRITHSNLFGTYGTPNISGALVLPTFRLKDSYTKLRASYGYAVTEATPTQLFNPLRGNPNLTPEKMEGWDVGAVQSLFNDRVKLQTTFFKNNLRNLIVYDFAKWRFENISRARTRGWESSIEVEPIKNLKARLNYNYTYGRQFNTFTNTYTELVANPRHVWSYLLTYSPKPGYSIFTTGLGTSDRQGFTKTTDGFFDMGVGATAKIFEKKGFKLSFWGKLANLFNQKYEMIEGYKQPGIHFIAGLRLTKTF